MGTGGGAGPRRRRVGLRSCRRASVNGTNGITDKGCAHAHGYSGADRIAHAGQRALAGANGHAKAKHLRYTGTGSNAPAGDYRHRDRRAHGNARTYAYGRAYSHTHTYPAAPYVERLCIVANHDADGMENNL